MIFRNAQVREIIAEFRWVPADAKGNLTPLQQGFVVAGKEAEEFIERFRTVMSREGYVSSERLVPQNGLHPAFAPIVRYRGTDEAHTVVIQIGLGVMSVHALPPYRTWVDFKPEIERALNAVKEAREPAWPNVPATGSLRYINGFGQDFREGLSERDFLERMLQIKLELPSAITRSLDTSASVDANVQFSAALSNGMSLTLSAGTLAPGPSDLVLDTTVAFQKFVPLDGIDLLTLLEEAHNRLREMFYEMTTGLHEKLQLTGATDASTI